jgi:hypothetical protein
MPNRKARSMRLECEVGMEARLVSNYRPLLFGWLDALVAEGPEYCGRSAPRYLFFADRPLFSVTLVAGARRETLPVDRLYAGASRDPEWKDDLPYCDCEVLVERAYFVPLGDRSWPDDTLVEFEYMKSEPAHAALGEAAVVDFDSGYEVWLYREKLSELVLLFAPSGVVTKTRIR